MSQLYKKLSLVMLLAGLSAPVIFAQQKPLTPSRQSSYYTYIYKLEPNEVGRFYKDEYYEPGDKVFQTLVDSSLTDKAWVNKLPPGNYIQVHADKNRLQYKLIENHSAFLKLMLNNDDMPFAIIDRDGNRVTDAIVHVKNRLVNFEPKSGLYHTRLRHNDVVVRVDYRGTANFFNLTKGYKGYYRGWITLYRLKQRWYRLKRFLGLDGSNERYYDPMYERQGTGIMVFNKPKYKPLDTVKFKAFIVTRRSDSPIGQPRLLIRLLNRNDRDGKILGWVNSYRDGAYEGSFVLSDSLKLELDDQYTVSLEDPSSARYKLGDYDGDDKNKLLLKRKVYYAGTFDYEDYELKSITFTGRVDKGEHWPGNPPALYLKATDENDLPVADGRVKLVLASVHDISYKTSHTFVPDTLWVHEVNLEQAGETKVVIPDSIFPKASMRYTIDAHFLNSNNESRSWSESIRYTYERSRISAELKGDSLIAVYQRLGKDIKANARIIAQNNKYDTLSIQKVLLPAHIKLDPNIFNYTIETDSASEDVFLKDKPANISISGYRTADSLFVKIHNERHLHFWYSVFAGQRLIDAGQADELSYHRAFNEQNLITFQLNYIWAGESRSENAVIEYQEKLLNVYVKQPMTVYPGQRVTSEIVVTDQKGKPVPGVDLTAWAITRKFSNYQKPYIPYLGKSFVHKQRRTNFSVEEKKNSGAIALNWNKWSLEMGLDSIAYYRFTHPRSVYQVEESIRDTLTQIAPFVVNGGDIIPVHVLYIDEKPVYFSQAEQLQHYSFHVNPGKHNLRFRTAGNLIRLDNVDVEQHKKLILSVNADTINHVATIVKMPDSLSDYEARALDNYMMTIADNFKGKMVLLEQGNSLIMLNRELGKDNNYRSILTGPLSPDYASLTFTGNTLRGFFMEPDYTYTFEPDLLKQKSIPTKYPFTRKLSPTMGTEDYTQYALDRAEADSIWRQYLYLRSSTISLFDHEPVQGKVTGILQIDRNDVQPGKQPQIKNVIIYRYDDPDFLRVYPGVTTSFGRMAKGKYRVMFLLRNDSYDIKENIEIKPYGTNYYRFDILPSHPRDSVSIRINDIITSRESTRDPVDGNLQNDALKIKETFNDKYFDVSSFNQQMSGTIVGSDDKQPVIGATVKVKGMNRGVVTDVNGNFRIVVPQSGKLIISYIGYKPREIEIRPGTQMKIVLEVSSSALNEVVVVGYSSARKKDISGSVATITTGYGLTGKVAGLGIFELDSISTPGSSSSIRIRGFKSLTGSGKPLIIIDGVPYPNLDIDPNTIGDISILKDAAATALYGSQAANGVILITTKPKSQNLASRDTASPQATAETLRKNFSDYAYWQPKLTTDAGGKASFTTTFPDDITNWRTFVAAINGQKQTGFSEKEIKAFKPLSANFVSPQFAVKGDQMNVIGKVLNYTSDTVELNRQFSFNGKMIRNNTLSVKNSHIDTMSVTAEGPDSLTFEYSIKRGDSYFDGERRKIPLVEQGAIETKGIFEALEKDTTILFKFDPALGPITFHAEASVLPTLLDEAEKLRNYQYLCNEQLASKLIGLLAEKRIKDYVKEPFKWDRNIQQIIKKLLENRRPEGTWGWWKNTDEELWISLHALHALAEAKQQGYDVQLDGGKLAESLVHRLENYREIDKLTCLEIVKKLNVKVDYQKYCDSLDRRFRIQKVVSKYDRFRLILLKQQANILVSLDSVLNTEHHTMFGNVYWGEENYRFFDNSIQLTVLAYKILKTDGKYPELLSKIRGYFLEQRRTGDWRNTYETSLILETILPDVLTEGGQVQPTIITLSGAKSETVNKFPYSATFSGTELNVTKTGTLPVYITGYQQFWNKNPKKVSKDFAVNSWFERNGDKITKLRGGETVELRVEVKVNGDADFVMINIPIPAGCSYESKEQPWENEVHREYFKDRVSIFSRKLKQGTYTFTVQLMPRYGGIYHLNPAKAEMMYFPVFYGREGMKKVSVE